MMIYNILDENNSVVVKIEDRLTYSDYGSFRQVTDAIGQTECESCILDLTKLDFIDSAGLGMLLLARDKSQERQCSISLRNASGQVRKMIDLGRFDSLFKIINNN